MLGLIKLLIFVLPIIGGALLIQAHPLRTLRALGLRDKGARLLARLWNGRKKTLRQKIDQAQGKTKSNFFVQNLTDAKRILLSTNQGNKIQALNRVSILCFCAGAVLSLVIGNLLMLPVLSVGFALIPMWYIRYSEVRYKKRLCDELEVALSVITSSYTRTDNLLQSVEENLTYLNEPVKSAFSRFVNQVKYVDANLHNGIRGLKASINNPVFHDWCDILLLCASDRTYKQSLTPVVEQFNDNRSLQNALETIIQMPVREFNGVIGVVLITLPVVYMLNKDWFFTLVGTWGGKAILAALSVVLFAGMNKAISLAAPIE